MESESPKQSGLKYKLPNNAMNGCDVLEHRVAMQLSMTEGIAREDRTAGNVSHR